MGVKKAISEGFSVAKKSFSLVAVWCVFSFCVTSLIFLVSPSMTGGAETDQFSLFRIGAYVICTFCGFFLQAGTTAYIYNVIKNGTASVSDFIPNGKKYYIKFSLVTLLVALATLLLVFITILSYNMLECINQFVAIAVAAIPAFLSFCFLFAVLPIATCSVVEEHKIGTVIKLAAQMVRQKLLSVLGMSFYLGVFGIGIALISIVTMTVLFFMNRVFSLEMNVGVISSFVTAPIEAYFGVVCIATVMSFYLAAPRKNNLYETIFD